MEVYRMNLKKYAAVAALIGAIGFTGISLADARGYYGPGPGNCGSRYCDNCSNIDRNDEKASAFLDETKELRKELVVKKSELDALMRQDNPDEKKVATLTGELFDLQNNLDEKAEKTFAGNPGYGSGPGPGYGNCGRRGGW
jgi:hypothetical protein